MTAACVTKLLAKQLETFSAPRTSRTALLLTSLFGRLVFIGGALAQTNGAVADDAGGPDGSGAASALGLCVAGGVACWVAWALFRSCRRRWRARQHGAAHDAERTYKLLIPPAEYGDASAWG